MIRCYRLCSQRYALNSGKGAARFGGRWNPEGVEVVYAAASPSLATLEILVHYAVLPRDFVLTEIQIPSRVKIKTVEDADLPERFWKSLRPLRASQEIGRRWVYESRTVALSVPSTIVPVERNYAINPSHPDFARIRFLPSRRFLFDPRLK